MEKGFILKARLLEKGIKVTPAAKKVLDKQSDIWLMDDYITPLSSSMVTVKRLLPRLDRVSVTEEVAPSTKLTNTTRATTPMMMPSMVSTARSLLEPMERRAIFKERIIVSPP